ncbi:MAG: response regulator [Desulfobacula sp.]|jgi:CheY-like chemotaxis protein|uniref:response regulator n=1 Tax=Desulfobacula sp. TaxID=2593537 RepID=UPI001D657952|nr:response regulator [Desulfobacula sp.]MBT3485517.1 response regulator [Desulfobacula sp.]MBT3805334.1 response regulator [Desulfobacula sp.]MBT4025686.1 response regulator [Desulfobacula sp.]MBT4197501.1 response regulator [Desulfobacula sp.]
MGNELLKIIIVDDNTDYLFTMKTFLSRNGFQVKTAPDGQTGIELIRKERPNLVMLDVMMETTFSGFEVCRQIRNDPDLKNTPIIGITGMEDELGLKFDKYDDAEYFSPDVFFDKPVDKDALLQKIKDLIL